MRALGKRGWKNAGAASREMCIRDRALWCMFAQVFPLFQDARVFTTIPVLYADGFMDAAVRCV